MCLRHNTAHLYITLKSNKCHITQAEHKKLQFIREGIRNSNTIVF
jgi:hypothetical protein